MDLFVVKKILGYLLMPTSIIVLLMLLSLIFMRSHTAFARKALALATVIIVIAATPLFTVQISNFVETYPAFKKQDGKLDYIVVLGFGHSSDENWPATSQLRYGSLQRLVEAIRIHRLHPEATIITSGASLGQPISNAETVKQAAILMGVPAHKIITEPFPKDTEEEAELIAPRVAQSRFALVTSANHMQRSVNYFTTYGASPIPAPASPYSIGDKLATDRFSGYLPYGHNIGIFTDAWHEVVGQAWQWLRS